MIRDSRQEDYFQKQILDTSLSQHPRSRTRRALHWPLGHHSHREKDRLKRQILVPRNGPPSSLDIEDYVIGFGSNQQQERDMWLSVLVYLRFLEG
jgi:hypothetical protein